MSAVAGVKDRIIQIIQATEPDEHARATRGKFKHQPKGVLEDAHVPDRSFSLLHVGGNSSQPGYSQHKGRFDVAFELVVLYKASIDQNARDTVMASDAENLVTQLLAETGWNRPASRIELIGGRNDNRSSIPWEVVPLDDGANLLIFQVPVVYSRGPETNTPTV